ncbi:aspartate dehydrogenase [Marivita hallyeonensis]|uniref:Aspartate dehydrogenase n=1 Tax=Marivita hallyeonensis TaxID=996342 RepID=A0A1M5N7M7_9RHOB|nr:aspartate dehydrogenase [Marivita hallyeonensis]SHG85544.1 aspartate dehydrogenase [Marivita hallyeonensis]
MKVGIAGLGAIGLRVAQELDRGGIPGCTLAGIATRNAARAADANATLNTPAPVYALHEIARQCDVVIETLPPTLFLDLARPTIEAGKTLVVLTASQLLGQQALIDRAAETGATIAIPSGAILGLDAIKGAAEGEITSAVIETRKPVAGLIKAPYVQENGIDLTGLTEPMQIIAGPVVDIARHFPANVNVAVAVSLAGIGPEKTRMEVWADPSVTRNLHTVRVTSDSSDFTMSIQNRPSDENPATGKITALSVIAWLRQQTATLRVGT